MHLESQEGQYGIENGLLMARVIFRIGGGGGGGGIDAPYVSQPP